MSSPRPHPFRTPSTTSPKPSLLPSPFPREPYDLDNASPSSRPTTAVNIPPASEDHLQSPSKSIHDTEQTDQELQVSGSGLLPPHTFVPFFSLVKDTSSGQYVHPSVYYVFQDDDPELMTTAILDAIQSTAPYETTVAGEDELEYEDRYIIVDVHEDGHTIQAANSLSSRWAVTSAKLQPAPVFGGTDNTSGDAEETASLMLVVEGNAAPELDGMEDTARAEGIAPHSRQRRPERVFEVARDKSGQQSITTIMTDIYASMEAQLSPLENTVVGSSAS